MGNTSETSKTSLLAGIMVFLISVLVYMPTLKHSFVWDDVYILQNEIGKVEGYNIFQGSGGMYYRPFHALSNEIDYYLWGNNPMGFHLTNIVLNAFVSTAIFILLYLIINNSIISFLLSLVFIFHPVHPDSVAWISGRTDIIMALFFVLSFISYILYRRGDVFVALFLCAFFWMFSLLGKETAIVLPLIAICYDILIKKKKWKEIILPQVVFFITFVLYFFLRGGLRYFVEKINPGLHIEGVTKKIVSTHNVSGIFKDAGLIIGFYIKKLLIPVELLQYNHLKDSQILLFVFLFLGWALFMLIKKNWLGLFSVFFIFLTILPATAVLIAPEVGSYSAVRYLYLPVFGFVLLIYSMLKQYDNKRIITASLVIIIAIYIPLFFKRITVWRNNYTLWRYEVRQNPSSAMAHFQYALSLIENVAYDKADREFDYILENLDKLRYRRSMDIKCSAYAMKGVLNYDLGRIDKAEPFLIKALKCNDKINAVNYHLGLINFKRYLNNRNDSYLKRALFYFLNEANLGKKSIDVDFMIGETYYLLKDRKNAIKYLKEVIINNPGNPLSLRAVKLIQKMGGENELKKLFL